MSFFRGSKLEITLRFSPKALQHARQRLYFLFIYLFLFFFFNKSRHRLSIYGNVIGDRIVHKPACVDCTLFVWSCNKHTHLQSKWTGRSPKVHTYFFAAVLSTNGRGISRQTERYKISNRTRPRERERRAHKKLSWLVMAMVIVARCWRVNTLN